MLDPPDAPSPVPYHLIMTLIHAAISYVTRPRITPKE